MKTVADRSTDGFQVPARSRLVATAAFEASRMPSAPEDGCFHKPLRKGQRKRRSPGEKPALTWAFLSGCCETTQQARKTAELADLLATASESTREINGRPLPQQNTLHRSVVKLLIEDYEAGASTYQLAERYNVRRNTVRDTLRRAGFDLAVQAKRAALSEEQKTEARRLFEGGSTRRELRELYGVSESTIRRALRTP